MTAQPGVIGPLPAPRQMVRGRVGCCPNNSGRVGCYRTAAGTAAGGWGSLGGLSADQPGVIGPLPAPRQMVRDRVGCCPKILGLSDRCRHRGRWLGAGWVVDRRSWSYRTAAGVAAGGWGSFGGLLSEDPGVIGPLPAPRRVVGGRWVGCRLTNPGLSDRCRCRGGWLGVVWWVVAAGTAVGGWGSFGGLSADQPGVIGPLPAPRQMVRGRVGCCPKILGLSDRCRHRGRWLGVGWVVVRTTRVIGPLLPTARRVVRGRLGGCWG